MGKHLRPSVLGRLRGVDLNIYQMVPFPVTMSDANLSKGIIYNKLSTAFPITGTGESKDFNIGTYADHSNS